MKASAVKWEANSIWGYFMDKLNVFFSSLSLVNSPVDIPFLFVSYCMKFSFPNTNGSCYMVVINTVDSCLDESMWCLHLHDLNSVCSQSSKHSILRLFIMLLAGIRYWERKRCQECLVLPSVVWSNNMKINKCNNIFFYWAGEKKLINTAVQMFMHRLLSKYIFK